eukprot:4191212-Amphidinium_carterae.1
MLTHVDPTHATAETSYENASGVLSMAGPQGYPKRTQTTITEGPPQKMWEIINADNKHRENNKKQQGSRARTSHKRNPTCVPKANAALLHLHFVGWMLPSALYS